MSYGEVKDGGRDTARTCGIFVTGEATGAAANLASRLTDVDVRNIDIGKLHNIAY